MYHVKRAVQYTRKARARCLLSPGTHLCVRVRKSPVVLLGANESLGAKLSSLCLVPDKRRSLCYAGSPVTAHACTEGRKLTQGPAPLSLPFCRPAQAALPDALELYITGWMDLL